MSSRTLPSINNLLASTSHLNQNKDVLAIRQLVTNTLQLSKKQTSLNTRMNQVESYIKMLSKNVKYDKSSKEKMEEVLYQMVTHMNNLQKRLNYYEEKINLHNTETLSLKRKFDQLDADRQLEKRNIIEKLEKEQACKFAELEKEQACKFAELEKEQTFKLSKLDQLEKEQTCKFAEQTLKLEKLEKEQKLEMMKMADRLNYMEMDDSHFIPIQDILREVVKMRNYNKWRIYRLKSGDTLADRLKSVGYFVGVFEKRCTEQFVGIHTCAVERFKTNLIQILAE